MSFPAFTKVGTMFATPSWMSTTYSAQLIFPRLFDNDAHRSVLTGLPASSYSVLYCTDHSAGTGAIGRVDFSSIEGTWTDSGAAIHTGTNQRETPHPVYDPINERVNVYVHDNTSTVTYGSQAARLLTTTDLATLTDQGEIMAYGNHTGYGKYSYSDSLFHAYANLTSNEVTLRQYATSADGETYTFNRLFHESYGHLVGAGYTLNAVPFIFTYNGGTYRLCNITTRPRIAAYPSGISAIVAVPLDPTTLRPIGGYYTLITPGAGGSDDEYLTNYYDFQEIGGTLYLIYVGRKVSDSTQRILLAKSTVGSSSQSTLNWSVRSNGALVHDTKETVVVDWDAANDSVPAGVTITARSGTNSSTQSVGNYYELKTGSASSQDLLMQSTATIDPDAVETVELEIENLQFKPDDPSKTQIQIGFVNGFAAVNGPSVLWTWEDQELMYGRGQVRSGSSTIISEGAFVVPWSDVTFTSEQVAEWTRTFPLKITMRIHDYGDRFSVLVNDHVAYHKDISAVSWTNDVFGFVRILSTVSAFPQFYARFTNFKVRTLTGNVGTERRMPRGVARGVKRGVAL